MTTYDTSDRSEPGYYIVNPEGTIQECTKKHATARFQQVGWRMATAAEVALFHKVHERRTSQRLVKGKLEDIDTGGPGQSWHSPLGTPYSSDPAEMLKTQAEEAVAEAPTQSHLDLTEIATPSAIELAEAEGIDILGVAGSGKGGRVVVEDVRNEVEGQS